jgi:hypothetical protein
VVLATLELMELVIPKAKMKRNITPVYQEIREINNRQVYDWSIAILSAY